MGELYPYSKIEEDAAAFERQRRPLTEAERAAVTARVRKRRAAITLDEEGNGFIEGVRAPALAGAAPSQLEEPTKSEQRSENGLRKWLHERPEDHETRAVYCANCGCKKTVKVRCSGRTCPECRGRELMRLKDQYGELMAGVLWPNFVTISPENVERLTRADVKRFHRVVKKVLRRKRWKEAIPGGLLFAECTNIGNGWHPHLHGLMDARWIEGDALAKEIAKELGRRVFVKPARKDAHWVLNYCLGYLKKAPDIYRVDGLPKKESRGRMLYCGPQEAWNRKREYDVAYRGVHTVIPFGTLYNVPKPEKRLLTCPDCGEHEWISEWGLERMIDQAEEVMPDVGVLAGSEYVELGEL